MGDAGQPARPSRRSDSMNTQSRCHARVLSTRRVARAGVHCRLLGPSTGRYGANCGRTVRSTLRRWRSPESLCSDSHSASIAGIWEMPLRLNPAQPASAIRYGGRSNDAYRYRRERVLLSGRVAQRAPRPQHSCSGSRCRCPMSPPCLRRRAFRSVILATADLSRSPSRCSGSCCC